MTTKNARVIALVFAMAAAVFASRVEAQQISAERAAALQKCNTEADVRYPVSGDIEFGRERTDWYQACMAKLGQEP
jgi:hypothetical protein